ncbi:hypothetical protein CQ062_02890 [Ochrobactrum sp. MYb68]|nr:hypothetical protein CQ062_02890 [Ochrobactrum sp. MYb68]
MTTDVLAHPEWKRKVGFSPAFFVFKVLNGAVSQLAVSEKVMRFSRETAFASMVFDFVHIFLKSFRSFHDAS